MNPEFHFGGESENRFFANCKGRPEKSCQNASKTAGNMLNPSSFSQPRHLFLGANLLHSAGGSVTDLP
jgi:hypothetical protein